MVVTGMSHFNFILEVAGLGSLTKNQKPKPGDYSLQCNREVKICCET